MHRVLATLLAVLSLTAVLSVVTGSSADAGIAVDRRLSRSECALTGRLWVPSSNGCARHRCVAGSTMFKEGHDAELCRLAGKDGAEYARPISADRCKALGRVWIGEINSCASNPNRGRRVVEHSSRCRGASSTYVNHSENEGRYDECLTPHRVTQLTRIAKRKGTSLNEVALNRSRYNCSYRGGWVMKDGLCVKRQGPPPPAHLGGFYMVGDSVSWRAEDELAPKQPSWVLDLRPGRRLDELPERLAWYRSDHGNPAKLVVQLGTNRRPDFNEKDFRAVMGTVPATTPVLFLLPYRKFTGDNEGPVRATKKYASWMRHLAADRPRTCLADWPKVASRHLSNLVDGEHPDAQHEDWYADYVVRSWKRCAHRLGI